MSNTPRLLIATSCARSITANVSTDTTTGATPAAALTFDTSESGVHVVITPSSRFISSNTPCAARAAWASSSVHMYTVITVPIAWPV